jgi:hypothetical protein
VKPGPVKAPLDRAFLRAKATAAFRGPWIAETWEVYCEEAEADCEDVEGERCGGEHDVITLLAPDEYPDGQVVAQIDEHDGRIRTPGLEGFARANAEHIAAANPGAILELLDELERVEGERDAQRIWLDIAESGNELRRISELMAERDRLRAEVNALRSRIIGGRSGAQ